MYVLRFFLATPSLPTLGCAPARRRTRVSTLSRLPLFQPSILPSLCRSTHDHQRAFALPPCSPITQSDARRAFNCPLKILNQGRGQCGVCIGKLRVQFQSLVRRSPVTSNRAGRIPIAKSSLNLVNRCSSPVGTKSISPGPNVVLFGPCRKRPVPATIT